MDSNFNPPDFIAATNHATPITDPSRALISPAPGAVPEQAGGTLNIVSSRSLNARVQNGVVQMDVMPYGWRTTHNANTGNAPFGTLVSVPCSAIVWDSTGGMSAPPLLRWTCQHTARYKMYGEIRPSLGFVAAANGIVQLFNYVNGINTAGGCSGSYPCTAGVTYPIGTTRVCAHLDIQAVAGTTYEWRVLQNVTPNLQFIGVFSAVIQYV